MEVIYSGLHRTPEQIAQSAMQEDVDVVGLSILSGSHMELLPAVRAELDSVGLTEVLLVAGGIIPDEDAAALESQGYARIFGPGSVTGDIADFIEQTFSGARP